MSKFFYFLYAHVWKERVEKAAEGGTGDVFFKRILAAHLTVEGGGGRRGVYREFPPPSHSSICASPPMPRKNVSMVDTRRVGLVWFFWGALFPRTADPIVHESLCLHPPTAGLCPKTLHLDLVNPL